MGSGLTLFPYIFLAPRLKKRFTEDKIPSDYKHEEIHWWQQRYYIERYGAIRGRAIYFLEWFKGLLTFSIKWTLKENFSTYKIPFEKEAYDHEKEIDYRPKNNFKQ